MNLPDEESMAASQQVFELVKSLSHDDILLTLTSGQCENLQYISNNFTFGCKQYMK